LNALFFHQITQLRHDIASKNQLIQIYSEDLELNEIEGDNSTESFCNARDKGGGSSTSGGESTYGKTSPFNWDVIQEQINILSNENHKLRSEASKRTLDIEAEEKKELLLIQDCAKQLSKSQFLSKSHD